MNKRLPRKLEQGPRLMFTPEICCMREKQPACSLSYHGTGDVFGVAALRTGVPLVEYYPRPHFDRQLLESLESLELAWWLFASGLGR